MKVNDELPNYKVTEKLNKRIVKCAVCSGVSVLALCEKRIEIEVAIDL